MPKSTTHWAHDLATVVLVLAVSALVFWLVPAQAACAAPDPARVELRCAPS
jgi:hypothetical protein